MVTTLKDYFTIVKGKADSVENYRESDDTDAVAYVSASTNYNGIKALVSPNLAEEGQSLPEGTSPDKVFPADTLTVAAQGQGSVGYATVQPMPFVAAATVLVLIPKQGLSFSKEQLFLMAAVIRKNRWRYGFGRPISPDRCARIIVPENIKQLLPVLPSEVRGSTNL